MEICLSMFQKLRPKIVLVTSYTKLMQLLKKDPPKDFVLHCMDYGENSIVTCRTRLRVPIPTRHNSPIVACYMCGECNGREIMSTAVPLTNATADGCL